MLGTLFYLAVASGYGGWNGVRGTATGFFHVEQIDGVWWLIDPEGNAFLSKGVNHVNYRGDHSPALGYSPYGRATQAKYGSEDAFAQAAVQRLRGWGFNTIGAWSNPSTHRQGMAYAPILDLAARAGGDWQRGVFPDVFSDAFRAAVESRAAELCGPRRDDPFLLGWFTDNELRWGPDWRSPRGLIADFLATPTDSAGRRAVDAYLREQYDSIAAFNGKWETSYPSFEAAFGEPPSGPAREELLALESGFVRMAADRYFRVCAEAIRAVDPNHLIIGCRFAGYAPPAVVEAMAPHIDLVSYNHYGELPPEARLRDIHQRTSKPIMLTEFSFKAMDSGLPNTRGAGTPVAAQADRARLFENYVTALMRLPYMVGYHWFEHADEPAEGRFDGENSNYGVVNLRDEPWETLVRAMTALNGRVEAIHAGRD